MTFSTSQRGRKYLFVFGLAALGFAGNVYSLPVGYGVNFLFGSIFVVIAARYFGVAAAITTALLSSSYTYILWNQPYAIVIFSFEALWLGVRLKKHRNIVIADLLFWLTAGAPLVILFYYFVMSLGVSATATVYLKQTVNGISNALLASIAISHLPVVRRLARPKEVPPLVSYSTIVFHLTASFLIFPTLTLLITGNYRESKMMQQLVGDAVTREAYASQQVVESWMERHIQAAQMIADIGGGYELRGSSQLQSSLELVKRSLPDFHDVLVVDSHTTTVGAYPPTGRDGASTLGRNFDDTEWFETIRGTLHPHVSRIFIDKRHASDPMLAVGAPIVDAGQFRGVGLGTLRLDRLKVLLDSSTAQGRFALSLYDENTDEICSTKSSRLPLVRDALGDRVKLLETQGEAHLWLPRSKKNVPFMDSWRDAVYFVSLPVAGTSWTLLSEASVAPIQAYVYRETVAGLSLVFALFVAAIVISFVVSRSFAREPAALASISKGLQAKLATASQVEWPESNILEIADLTTNFKDAAASIRRQIEEIGAINASLEQRVEARTKEVREVNASLLESRLKLRTLIETIPDLVWLKDPNGVFLACNPKFERFLGAPEDEIVGKTDYDFVDKELADRFLEDDKAAIASGKPSLIREIGTYADDGHREMLETLKTPMYGDDGRVVGVLGIARDITERTQMEEKLRQAHKMEAMGTLAGGIAHDFNNILFVIVGYAELLSAKVPLGSAARQMAEEILVAANRAKDLVRQILTFSRKSIETQSPLEPFPLVKEGLKLIRASLPTTVEIREDMDAACGRIMANPTQVHQVLVNLCTNALHAMEAEKGVLTVSLSRVRIDEDEAAAHLDAFPGTFVELRVQDTGCGMDPPTMSRIFEPYFTTKEVGKGSGMGLALVHGIVKACGGFITVESEPGAGSTFHVYFPALEGAAEPVQDVEEMESLPTGEGNILIVDDEEIIIRMQTRALESLGYAVSAYSDSEEALDAFRRAPRSYDLVITDQTMPRLSGVELAKEILRIRSDTPVILCTGYSSVVSEPELRELGIRGFLMKPVSIKTLAVAAREALDGSESGRARTP